VATRTVMVFEAGSELLYLPHRDSYVWQRPANGRSPEEVAIVAGSDGEALREVLIVFLCELLGLSLDDEFSFMLVNALVDRKSTDLLRCQHGQA